MRHPSLDAPFRGTRLRPSGTTAESAAPATRIWPDRSPAASEAQELEIEILRRARAFASLAVPGWFFSHVTAAVLWRLPVPLRVVRAALESSDQHGRMIPARGIDVAALDPRRAPKAAGVSAHQLSRSLTGLASTQGLTVTGPVTTWAHLAPFLSVDELVEVGDAIVYIPRRRGMQRGTPADAMGTAVQLHTAAQAPYRRHAEKLRDAADLVRVGAASPPETRIRLAVGRAGLPEPELDVDVFALDGAPLGFTELAFPEFMLLVEYEGDHHRTDRDQWRRDVEKHSRCQDAGWRVLRLTSAHVYPSVEPAVARIRAALIQAGWGQ